jgi:hypothetical protein
VGTVEVCAKVVEFLAIDLSDYVTGAVIPIDGGGLIRESQPPAFPVALRFDSIVDTGIELSCSTRLLPTPIDLNGKTCQLTPSSGCLGYTLRDTLSRTARIEKPQKL